MSGVYDFIGCAKRLGAVLIGRTEPSVHGVQEVAKEIVHGVGLTLREMWNSTTIEPIPDHLQQLLASLPEDNR